MGIFAGEWWDSDPWWQFVLTLIIGVVVGCLGAWATLRAGNPKRKINWWVESNTSLLSLSERPDNGQELTVHLGAHAIRNPRVVELVIANVGSRDITAGMFHADEPMRFDFGQSEVYGVLARRTDPEGTVMPTLEIGPIQVHPPTRGIANAPTTSADSWLDLAPCLLKRGQSVTVTVLLSGEEERVRCLSAGLVDVDVVSQSPGRRTQAVMDAMSGVTFYLGPLALRVGGSSPGRLPGTLR
ncbi:hypothetical protein [Streptomyces pseudovenezuelae]|uniref:hypothetical protein n=1 Tax=Streptomyces pseudovenezuelae TaxID=67350 RepID=UPI002E370136|nr:hypothetical protein [Streptomyces pseudovenezuelae]